MTSTDTLPPNEVAAMFRRLEDLHWNCQQRGSSRHDQAIVLVAACIEEGITKGPHIVGTVASMGFKPRHVGKLLHDNIGNLWQRDGERFYTTLPPLN